MIKEFMFLAFVLVAYLSGMSNLMHSVETTQDTKQLMDKSIIDVNYEVKKKKIYSKEDILYVISNEQSLIIEFGGKTYTEGDELQFLIDTIGVNEDEKYSYSLIENNTGEKVIKFA